MNRGRPSKLTILNNKNRDHCVAINITIPQKLLNKVEQNIVGESRSEKIVKCIEAGYPTITNANAVMT